MDHTVELAMNGVFAFALMGIVIALASMIGNIATAAINARRDLRLQAASDRGRKLAGADEERLRSVVDRLEERLETLERIATDRPGRLTAEIERLR